MPCKLTTCVCQLACTIDHPTKCCYISMQYAGVQYVNANMQMLACSMSMQTCNYYAGMQYMSTGANMQYAGMRYVNWCKHAHAVCRCKHVICWHMKACSMSMQTCNMLACNMTTCSMSMQACNNAGMQYVNIQHAMTINIRLPTCSMPACKMSAYSPNNICIHKGERTSIYLEGPPQPPVCIW